MSEDSSTGRAFAGPGCLIAVMILLLFLTLQPHMYVNGTITNYPLFALFLVSVGLLFIFGAYIEIAIIAAVAMMIITGFISVFIYLGFQTFVSGVMLAITYGFGPRTAEGWGVTPAWVYIFWGIFCLFIGFGFVGLCTEVIYDMCDFHNEWLKAIIIFILVVVLSYCEGAVVYSYLVSWHYL